MGQRRGARPGGTPTNTDRDDGRGGGWPPRNRPGSSAPTSGRSRARRGLLLTAAGLSLAVLAATGALWSLNDYAMNKVERVPAFRGLDDRPTGSAGVNVLLAGSDRRADLSPETRKKLHLGRSPGRRSDTMILAHFSPGHERATLVSLPRDWYVTIPEHGNGEQTPAQQNKLNAAYALGGANLTVATVEENTGIRIDHYVEASFLGFVKVINALGGVDICVPRPIDDPASGLTLPAGKSHLDGVQSLKYVRARKTLGDGSDLDRIDRQQKFLGAMMQQALSTGTLLNPVRFSRVLNGSLDAVAVDRQFSGAALRTLAVTARNLDPARVTFVTVPIADPGVSTDAGSAAVADKDKARRLFDRIRNDEPVGSTGREDAASQGERGREEGAPATPRPTIPPGRIEIEVYNDTAIGGLGARAAKDLREIGFLIEGPPRNADPPKTAKTTAIRYGPGRGDSARTLRAALPGATLREVPALGDNVQVVVGASYDGARDVRAATGATARDSAGGAGGSGLDLGARSAASDPCT